MAKAVRWCAWYDDGKKLSSETHSPDEIPSDGILIIVEKKRDNTVTVHSGFDYYYWTGENWLSGYQAALEKWLRKELPRLKFGRWTKDGIFAEAMAEVERWP